MPELRELIEKYALQNAVKYQAAPNGGAVMGKLMGEHTELRPRAKEISPLVQDVLDEVSKMTPDEWQERLKIIAPELLDELSERKEPTKGLPPLEGAENGVVMRFAPNPNGPPTLGSARGIIVNSEYVRNYGGKFLIRFDDTDPVKKRPMPEAYGWYLQDCSWLGAEPDEVVIASERVHLYYDVAKELICRNGAYVCLCAQTVFKEYKDKGVQCPHRDQISEHNMDLWKRMLDGSFDQGQAVLRIKTSMNHMDPAIRDWPAFRIATTPHPMVGERYRVWPLLDFESAVEDHLLAITHILRGKDLADSEKRQIYLYRHMNWTYPRVIHWGRVKIHQFGSFSTSKLRKAIEDGEYESWDDPRIPTVRALRSRGILAEALRKFMIELGVSETDIAISMESIYAENRKLVDPIANRFFFVWNPVLMRIDGNMPSMGRALLHPNNRWEFREIPAGNEVFVCQSDLNMLKPGEKIRLKDLCNIEILSEMPLRARFIGIDVIKGMKIIHWAPKNGLSIRVLRPDGQDDGIGEVRIAQELGKVVQFERYGYVRIHQLGDPLLAYFTHK